MHGLVLLSVPWKDGGLGFQGLGFEVWGLGFQGLGFGVCGFRA